MQAYGPHGLQSMVDHIVAAWSEDIAIRTNGLEHEAPNGYAVKVHEIAPGVVYDSAGVKITAIPVLHGDWKEAYGYRIDTPTRSIVLSGDTRPSPALTAGHRAWMCSSMRSIPPRRLRRNGASGGPTGLSTCARFTHPTLSWGRSRRRPGRNS